MYSLKKAAKNLAKGFLLRPPRGVQAGAGSYIYRPRRIDGARFVEIGDRSTIHRYAWIGAFESYANITYRPRITIGRDVHIGRYACLTAISAIEIEDGCLISEYVYISDHAHGMEPNKGLIVNQPLVSRGPVRIGANSFVGYRVCILPGVVLGRNCVVGAGAVVTHSFPDFSVIAGVPARLIRRRLDSLEGARAVEVGACD